MITNQPQIALVVFCPFGAEYQPVDINDADPMRVVTLRRMPQGHLAYDEYYIERSKEFGLCYEKVGGGGLGSPSEPFPVEAPYWVRCDEVPVKEQRSPEDGYWLVDGNEIPFEPRRLEVLPKAWANLNPGRWGGFTIFDDMIESATTWCSVCKDYFPTHDPGNACEHLNFCERCGDWTEANPADRKLCTDCGNCYDEDLTKGLTQ